MYFKKIETPGLAHYSYIIGDKSKACIVDPRRDISLYLEELEKNELTLEFVLETHRNEDYISGSYELGEKTGAKIYRSGHEDLDYKYGQEICQEDVLELGSLQIRALHTPGHTKGHMSYVLREKDREGAYMVFTGDALFMGDVGRTDFYGEEQVEEMTGLLYDSIFDKILPLGDEVLLLPAHGQGSACGESMEDRPFTSVGYERKHNPKLQVSSREEFIQENAKMRILPKYFHKMEACNLKAGSMEEKGYLTPLKMADLQEDSILVDLRAPEAFATNHIKDALYLGIKNLSSFLGAILDTEEEIVFLAEDSHYPTLKEAYLTARRIGFDKIKGYLTGGRSAIIKESKKAESIETIHPKEYLSLEGVTTLDVRDLENVEDIGEDGEGYYRLPLKVLCDKYSLLDKEEKIYILCNSGNMSTTAASILKKKGYNPCVILGGMEGVEEVKNTTEEK